MRVMKNPTLITASSKKNDHVDNKPAMFKLYCGFSGCYCAPGTEA